ncbi:MAG: N-acetylglucosamine-6-phosphate deacetylase, partial [Planctomycetaceae bacterium]
MMDSSGRLIVRARRYETGEPVQITIAGNRIERVEPAWPKTPVVTWPWVAPGLFDLQINGHGGIWFADRRLTSLQAAQAIRAYLAHGVAQLCPTLI